MPCKTWISTDRGKIALHALSDDDVYVRLRQAEQERAVITRRIEEAVHALGWDEDEEGQAEEEAFAYVRIQRDGPAANLATVIGTLFQEASRRRPVQQKLEVVRHVLEGTFAEALERRGWDARTMPAMFGEEN